MSLDKAVNKLADSMSLNDEQKTQLQNWFSDHFVAMSAQQTVDVTIPDARSMGVFMNLQKIAETIWTRNELYDNVQMRTLEMDRTIIKSTVFLLRLKPKPQAVK